MAVGSLAEQCSENVASLGSSGACALVLAAMEKHSENLQVSWTGCRALTFMSSYILSSSSGFGVKSVSVPRARQLVTTIAERFSDSDEIALWSSRALNAVHLSPGRSQLDVVMSSEPERKTFDIVMQTLVTHIRTRSDIVEENILSIAKMLSADVVREPPVAICEQLQVALKQYIDNDAIFVACCRVLISLQNRFKEILDYKLPQTILEIMKKYPKNDLVAQWGCDAIASMAKDAKNRDTLVACGACETVIRALQRGTGSDALVAVMLQKSIGNQALGLAACRAVHSLGIDSDEFRERLGAGGACEGVAKALLKYANSEDVAATGCKAIVTLARNNYSNQSKLGNAGACKSILEALETHRTSEPVAVWGCRAVETMVDGHDGNTVKMGAAGMCDAIAIAMQSHQAVAEVAGAGCGAVASLARHDRNTFILGVAGACEAVVSAVQRHADAQIIAVKGFAALGNLAMNPVNSGWLGPVGACSALIEAMKYHYKDEEVACMAWRAVADLGCDEGNVARLGDAGACELLVDAMTLHIGNVKAMEQSCRAMGHLCVDDKNVIKLVDAKACEKIVVALQVHQLAGEVVTQAYLAIFGLASRGPEIQERLLAEGCCEIVVSSLLLHGVASASVATNGLLAIQALAFNNPATQNALGSCDACDAVISMMLTHATNEQAAREGIVAMRCLMDNNIVNKHRLSGGDTCRLVSTILKRHMQSDRVCTNAFHVIYQLTARVAATEKEEGGVEGGDGKDKALQDSDLEGNVLFFVKNDVCASMVPALYIHIADAELVPVCCQAAVCLAGSADGKYRLGGAGMCKAASKSLQTHMEEASVTVAVCELVIELSTSYDSNKHKLGSAHICKHLVVSLQQHYQDDEALRSHCRAMTVLAERYDSNRQKLVAAGAADVLMGIIKRYQGEVPICLSRALSAVGGVGFHGGGERDRRPQEGEEETLSRRSVNV